MVWGRDDGPGEAVVDGLLFRLRPPAVADADKGPEELGVDTLTVGMGTVAADDSACPFRKAMSCESLSTA